MVKKILSVVVAFLMLFCTIPLSVFADDVLSVCPKCGERTYVQKTGLTVDACGIGVTYNSKHCNSCRYSYYDWVLFGVAGYKEFDSGSGDSLPADFISEWIVKNFGKDVKFSQFQAGGGSASPGGVGRNPSGYAGEGVPNYNSNGDYQMLVPVSGWYKSPQSENKNHPVRISSNDPYIDVLSNSSGSNLRFYDSYNRNLFNVGIYGKFTAPVIGTYQIYLGDYEIGSMSYNAGDSWQKVNLNADLYGSSSTVALSKGNIAYCYFDSDTAATFNGINQNICAGYNFIVTVKPVENSINKQTNITINNNTWNGNIYVDNTNKLTYIYPQYTINNETKISNNPIIYNEETKQYYTYDQTTNNYYYITYNAPTPSPTPSPSPDPGGSAPDPDNPSPSPSPSTAPGGSSDKETGGNSFFNFIFGFGSDTGKDENGKKGIIWSLISLLVSCVTFVVGMGTAYSYLFPFLPPGLCTTIHICVLVLFLFAVIKFIRSFI